MIEVTRGPRDSFQASAVYAGKWVTVVQAPCWISGEARANLSSFPLLWQCETSTRLKTRAITKALSACNAQFTNINLWF